MRAGICLFALADPRGHQGRAAPWVQILSFSCSFRQKICKIILLRELAPSGKSVTALDLGFGNIVFESEHYRTPRRKNIFPIVLLLETFDSLFLVEPAERTVYIVDGEIITFGRENINHGGHYSTDTSAYTAPYTGTYR